MTRRCPECAKETTIIEPPNGAGSGMCPECGAVVPMRKKGLIGGPPSGPPPREW